MTPNEQLYNLCCMRSYDKKQDYKKDKEKFLELLSKGANVNYICENIFHTDPFKGYHASCLYTAILCKNYYMAYLLLTHGADYDLRYSYTDIETVYIDGGSILKLLFEARLENSTNRKVKALFDFVFNKAVENADYSIIYDLYEEWTNLPKEYIEKIFTNINHDSWNCWDCYSHLLLEHSIQHDRKDIVKLLIQHGIKTYKECVERYVDEKIYQEEDVDEYYVKLLNYNLENLEDEQTM